MTEHSPGIFRGHAPCAHAGEFELRRAFREMASIGLVRLRNVACQLTKKLGDILPECIRLRILHRLVAITHHEFQSLSQYVHPPFNLSDGRVFRQRLVRPVASWTEKPFEKASEPIQDRRTGGPDPGTTTQCIVSLRQFGLSK